VVYGALIEFVGYLRRRGQRRLGTGHGDDRVRAPSA
jgi:hypothetical protein